MTPKPPATVHRLKSAPDPDAPPAPVGPRVSFGVKGTALGQIVISGVEFVADTIEHKQADGRLTITISGDMRCMPGEDRNEAAARIAGAVGQRVRGKG
jgi:hypothetical protein